MEIKEKTKNETTKDVRDVKATKQVKSTDAKVASRFKRKPLL
ncbi:MAG TPA: hypothetical protein VK609_00320 [Mucilaginibacter sp.]|nr:hypothetical protein [Mucilaginibacter sp.]